MTHEYQLFTDNDVLCCYLGNAKMKLRCAPITTSNIIVVVVLLSNPFIINFLLSTYNVFCLVQFEDNHT